MRLPGWRRNRIRTIVEGTLPYNRRRDDAWVKRGWKFYSAIEATVDPLDFGELSMKHPDLYWAHELHTSPDEGTEMLKHEIEARLLSGQNNAGISERTGFPAPVIEAYHELYFSVRDRLRFPSFVVHKVIGPSVHRGLTNNEPDILWKLYGFFGGPFVIDAMIAKFTNPAKAQRHEDVDAFIEDGIIGSVKRNGLVASHTMQINTFTQQQILDTWMKLREIEAAAENAQHGQATILANLEACFNIMPFSVGNKQADVIREADSIAGYAKLGVELRSEELMMVAAGQELPHKRLLENMPYPSVPGTAVVTEDEDK